MKNLLSLILAGILVFSQVASAESTRTGVVINDRMTKKTLPILH